MVDSRHWWSGVQCERIHLRAGTRGVDRIHSGHFFYFGLRGRLILRVENSNLSVAPGKLAFIPAGQRYSMQVPAAEPCAYHILRLKHRAFGLAAEADSEAWEILMALTRYVRKRPGLLSTGGGSPASVRRLLERMAKETAEQGPGSRPQLKALVLELLVLLGRQRWLLREWKDFSHNAPAFLKVKRALLYVDDHYAEPLAVPDLARVAGLSRSHFHAVFKQYAGMTVNAYLNRFRIGRACHLLRQTDDTVLSICYACGFGSPSRFWVAFRREMGRSPAVFRKGRSGQSDKTR